MSPDINTVELDKPEQRKNYLYASAVTFCLVTAIIFSFSAKNWFEQRALLDLYYFPVMVAAVALGWKWGGFYSLSATFLTVILYVIIPNTEGVQQGFLSPAFYARTILLNSVGIFGGLLSDSERKQKEKYREISIELKKANIKLQQRVLELTMLYDTARQLSASLNLDNILAGVLKSVMKVSDANAGFIYLRNSKNDLLEIRCAEGIVQNSPRRVTLKNGQGVLDFVSQTKKGLMIVDVADSRDFRLEFEDPEKTDIRSLACVPLAIENRVIGTLAVTTSRETSFAEPLSLEMLTTLANHAAIAIDNAETYQRVNQAYVDIIGNMVSSIETRDLASIHHCQRTMTLATDLAKQFMVTPEDITAIRYILLIDHLGQVATDKILLSMGEEYLANVHAQLDPAKPMMPSPAGAVRLLERVAPIVKSRHEWYDGSGDPDGKRGEQIPLSARILTVVDLYHNLTFGTHSSFRRYTFEEALNHLQSLSGKQFDPSIVTAFAQIVRNGSSASKVA